MIALDAALRRLTVCQLTRESRWRRPSAAGVASPQGGCWLSWTPDGILELEGEVQFLLSWSMKRTQKLLCFGLFSEVEWARA